MMQSPHPKSHSGFSLVDIMVGMVLGLLTMIVIMQSYSSFEGQKRTTTTGMEAQENGLIALHALETDIRQGGNGLIANGYLACNRMNTYDSTAGTPFVPNVPVYPILITDGGAGSDTITAAYSTSPIAGSPSTLLLGMDTSAKAMNLIRVSTKNGYNTGDVILISTPGSTLPCTRMVVTNSFPGPGGAFLMAWDASQTCCIGSGYVPHKFNPPAATNIFPDEGYSITGTASGVAVSTSMVLNMGAMAQNQYQVLCGSLTVTNLVTAAGAPGCTDTSTFTNATPLAGNIVSIQAQYGVAPAGSQSVNCWTNATGSACSGVNWAAPTAAEVARIKAIRVAVVARSSLQERPPTAGGTCNTTVAAPGWDGGAIIMTGITDWECYRYSVYQTVIPLRNVLWSNL